VSQSPEQLKFALFEREMIDPLKGHELSEPERYVACLLLEASSTRPLRITDLIVSLTKHFGKHPQPQGGLQVGKADLSPLPASFNERRVKRIIRTLRHDHALPILARRSPPRGLWWCSSIDEMLEFISDFRSQALDELTTLSKIVKHNYPALAGQLELTERTTTDGN
jgi:hypothetical protein